MLRGRQFFNILTSKCAFRHSGVQFCDIRTSKSGPNMRCFVHFDFQMCFSPQRRAIFRHQNFKKCSRTVSFLTFSLPNVLFATAACNFSTSELQTCGVLYIFTSKRAFRHSGVQFFDIRTSKSGPNMRCFVHFDFQMCFSPQRRAIFRHQNFKKCSRTVSFLTFSLTSKCAFRHSGVQFFDIRTSKSVPNMRCFVHFYFKMCFSPQRRAIFDFSSELRPAHPPH